jgi:hypothetical protein
VSISLLSKASGNPNFDQVFAPYVTGTSPPATGLLDDSGVDIATRYAPIIYGTQAPATGMLTQASGNADVNTLFAAYGTAVYTLPVNGVTFNPVETVPTGGSGSAACFFGVSSTSQFYIEQQTTDGAFNPPIYTYYSIPAGMTQVRLTLSYLSGVSGSKVTTTNNSSAFTAISVGVNSASVALGPYGDASGSNDTYWSLKIEFAGPSGGTVWQGTCTFHDSVDGSV